MDGVRGIRHQHHVSRPGGGQNQVRQPFFGANGGDSLGFRINIDVIPSFVPIRYGFPQLRDSPGGRIAVVVSQLGRFN